MKARVAVIGLAMVLALGALSACQQDTARLAVQYATMKVIEQGDTAAEQQQRAAKIHEIADKAIGLLSGESVTVDLIEAAVRKQVERLDLSPADRFLAGALVSEVAAELQKRVGTAALDEDKRLKVATVLGWVVEGAAYAGG